MNTTEIWEVNAQCDSPDACGTSTRDWNHFPIISSVLEACPLPSPLALHACLFQWKLVENSSSPTAMSYKKHAIQNRVFFCMLEFLPTTERGETLSRALFLFVKEARGPTSALVHHRRADSVSCCLGGPRSPTNGCFSALQGHQSLETHPD